MGHRPYGPMAHGSDSGGGSKEGVQYVARQILLTAQCLRNWLGEMTKKPIGTTHMERKHVFSYKNLKISPSSFLRGTLLNT